MHLAKTLIAAAVAVSTWTWAADPTYQTISRCFFVYAPIAQVGRDYSHAELFQFGQARVSWIGGYIQANQSNLAFKQVFESSLAANKRAGIQIENALISALDNRNQSQFSWAVNQAISCDRLIEIRTDFLPRL